MSTANARPAVGGGDGQSAKKFAWEVEGYRTRRDALKQAERDLLDLLPGGRGSFEGRLRYD